MKGLLGKKLGMTQIFAEDGTMIPVTVISAGPCAVLQKKEKTTDGYESVQLGYADKKEHRANRPEIGHAKKAGVSPKYFIREFRGVDLADYDLGQEVKADLFATGDVVDVTATSKGKGYAGSIKRHNQARGPMTHGSHYHRGSGSMGSMRAKRVFKGTRLPGRMGGEKVTIQNLQVVQVDADQNLILVKGSIPGPKNSYVVIKSAVKSR